MNLEEQIEVEWSTVKKGTKGETKRKVPKVFVREIFLGGVVKLLQGDNGMEWVVGSSWKE